MCEATCTSLADATGVTAAETRTFEADRDESTKIDTWIETIGIRWGADQKTIFRARLCVAELFANAIEHGSARSGRDHIIVTLAQCSDGIMIEFSDTCAAFDPTAVAIPDRPAAIEAAPINGRGLMFIRSYSTEFVYHRDGFCNRVTLRIKSP